MRLRRTLEVGVSGQVAGQLYDAPNARFAFRFANAYRSLSHRPVLGQRFEDDLTRTYTGNAAGRLPSFFANLLPEQGRLRDIILRHLKMLDEDDLALFQALASDLPGAVEAGQRVTGGQTSHVFEQDSPPGFEVCNDTDDSLRFSLAGVQLKFSMIRNGERLSLPAHGLGGNWIVKLASEVEWPGLAENECCMLDWAQAAGFDVPPHRVVAYAQLSGIGQYVTRAANALAIQRYDRADGRRIHQEDFAQVVGVPPSAKYQLTQDKLFALITRVLGADAGVEAFRRFVFSVASGNADAHLKNWSLIYPDGVHAALAPLYDQVSTIAWPSVSAELALRWMGSSSFEGLTAERISLSATRAGLERSKVLSEVQELVRVLYSTWPSVHANSSMLPDQVERLCDHWNRIPLLRSAGVLVK